MSDKDARCASCCHWKHVERDWQFEKLEMGTCSAVQMREDVESEATAHLGGGRWDDAAEPLIEAAMRQAKAIVVDGSSYYAALRTCGDFGCVLYRKRPTPTPEPNHE